MKKGGHHSKETKHKMALAHRGKRHSPETRSKMSSTHIRKRQYLKRTGFEQLDRHLNKTRLEKGRLKWSIKGINRSVIGEI